MKASKKVLSVIMAIIMIMCTSAVALSAFAAGNTEGECGDTAKYTLDDKGNLVVYGNGEISRGSFYHNSKITSVVIKNGITSVGYQAFFYCENLTEVSLPDSVETIDESAFDGCVKLTKINLDNVRTIENRAFYSCKKLEDIGSFNSVTINPDAFYNCGFKELDINSSVTLTGFSSGQTGTFSKCENLEKVTINTKIVSYNAFYGCQKLTSVNFGEKVETIYQYAFSKTGLISVKLPKNITEIGASAFINCWELKDADLSEAQINILPDNCFQYCSRLEKVQLPNCLKQINTFAFSGCNALVSITIPESVETIYHGQFSHIFDGCNNLQKIVVEEGNPNFYSTASDGTESNAIIIRSDNSNENDYIIYGCRNTVVPADVDVADYAFHSIDIDKLYIKKGIEYFGSDVCSIIITSYPNLTDIWYEGTQTDWENVKLSYFNNENINIHYNWNGEIERTVRFNANSADAVVTPLKYENVSSNVLISLPTPVWSGHKCLGWSLYSYVATADYYCGQAIKPELSATYYAVWEDDGSTPAVESYTVSFNANGGNVSPSVQTVIDGTAITLPTSVKSGFDFLGWSTDSNAASADYAVGESFTVTGNTTFYAVWKKQEITKTALVDSENGVQVEFDRDVFNSSVDTDNIQLNVERTSADTEADARIKDYGMTRVPGIDVYNIYLTCNGKEIQPNGKVTVKIAYSGTISDISKVKVFHYYTDVNGQFKSEKITGVRFINGYLVFETTHFSNFAFVEDININTAAEKEISYRSITTITATATNLSEEYKLAIYIGNQKVAEGDNESVSYSAGELKSDINYTVKVVDANGNVQKDSNGNEISKNGGKITCNAGFFKKLVAFFKGLFKTLPQVEVKP